MLIYENKEEGSSGFRVANVILVAGLGDCTAEAPFDAAQDRRRAPRKISKFEFTNLRLCGRLIRVWLRLCLAVSAVITLSQRSRRSLKFKVLIFRLTRQSAETN
jgi:hypothetical protein